MSSKKTNKKADYFSSRVRHMANNSLPKNRQVSKQFRKQFPSVLEVIISEIASTVELHNNEETVNPIHIIKSIESNKHLADYFKKYVVFVEDA